MKKAEREKLAKYFGLKGWGKGVYEQGLFDGLDCAKNHYKRDKKWVKEFTGLWENSFDANGETNEFEFKELIKFVTTTPPKQN